MSTTNTVNDNIRLNQIIDNGLNIYGSREKIRNNLVTIAKKYLNISNDSDISKASYLAYLIDMLSILSSNQIYYQSKIYNEFFIVSAVMNESVQNLAKWIGYTIPKATCATANVMFMIPLKFTVDINFNLSKYFQVRAGEVPFTIKSNGTLFDSGNAAQFNLDTSKLNFSTQGKIIDNSAITIRDYNGYYRPVFIGEDKSYCAFTLEFEQCEYQIQTFMIPEDLQLNQFYHKNLTFNGQVADLIVYVCEPSINQTLNLNSIQTEDIKNIDAFNPEQPIIDSSGHICKFTKWTECINGIYTISSTSKQYDWLGYYNKGVISFGNGILGKQPAAGSLVVCILKLTKGSEGNVINNTINNGDEISIMIKNGSSYTTSNISYECRNNNSAYGGKDILSTSEVKNNAIVNLKTRKRLVTDDDYNNITDVVEGTTMSDCVPILKRSDIRVNDITLYFILNYMNNVANEIVPTRNAQLDLIEPTWDINGQYVIPKYTTIDVGPNKLPFVTIFNLTLDKATRMGWYDYTATNVQGVTTELYTQSVYDILSQSVYFNCNTSNFSIDFNKMVTINNQYPVNVKLDVTNISNKVLLQEANTPDSTRRQRGDINYEWIVDDFVTTFRNDNTTNKTFSYFEILHFKGILITKWDNYEEYTELSSGYSDDYVYEEKKDEFGNLFATKTYKSIKWTIPSYTMIPKGKQRYEFQILCYAPKTDEYGRIYAINDNCVEYIAVDENGVWTEEKDSKVTDKVVMQWKPIKKYYSDVIITQDLSDCMQSSIGIDSKYKGVPQYKFTDGGRILTPDELSSYNLTDIKNMLDSKIIEPCDVYHVYEIPTIYKNYYDEAMNKENSDFELAVIQKLLENINFSDKRMMTDFTNIKFADTYGHMKNLIYNNHLYMVESRYNHTPWWESQQGNNKFPDSVATRENPTYVEPHKQESPIYYIANGKIDSMGDIPISEYLGYIVLRIVNSNNIDTPQAYSYTVIKPDIGDCIRIKDELDSDGNIQTCYWSGREWIPVEQYSIPLKLSLKIQVNEDTVATSDEALKQKIIEVLSEYYNDTTKMGLQRQIDRSEIIRVCRSVEGVQYVEVLNPQFDIKFEYSVDELKQEQLLQFTPQYVGFRTLTDTVTDYRDTSIDIEIVRK
jgi:hypothetical protein